MKWIIVNSRELLGSRCWRPARFLGGCHECSSVERCQLPQAAAGRIRLAELRVVKASEAVEQAQCELETAHAALRARLLQAGEREANP